VYLKKRKLLHKYCSLDNIVCDLCRYQADIELASLDSCNCSITRARLTIRGPHTNVRRGLFSYAYFLCLGVYFSYPKKLTIFSRRYVSERTFKRQHTNTRCGKNLAVDRGRAGGGGEGAPMVQPAQWLIQPCA